MVALGALGSLNGCGRDNRRGSAGRFTYFWDFRGHGPVIGVVEVAFSALGDALILNRMEVGAYITFRTLSIRTFQAVVKGDCTGLTRLGFGSRSGGTSNQCWAGRSNGSSSSRSGGLTSGRSLIASCGAAPAGSCSSLSKNPFLRAVLSSSRNRFRNGFVDGSSLSTPLSRNCSSSDWHCGWWRKFNGELISVLTGITHRGG